VIALPLLLLVAGSLVYCVMTVVAAVRYRAVRPPALKTEIGISVLKPLAGEDQGLEQNLRTYFEQDYRNFELLFAVRSADDPAVAVVESLRGQYPAVASRLIVSGEPPYPSAKVFQLDCSLAEARHDLLVMADSDVRVTPAMLSTIAAEFQDPRLGLSTCPYRNVPGPSLWSTLEAVGLNTEFIGGVLVARMLEGMKFALGPTVVVRRETLAAIGGFNAIKDYHAEDFVIGNLAAARGYGVILSSYVIEHRIGAESFRANMAHRLRWNRSTRRSRPWGYIGQVFTNPLPLVLLLWAGAPEWWPVVPVAVALRAAAGWATSVHALGDRLALRRWYLVPINDVLNFLVWLAGYFGSTILWRGRRYYIRPDGRIEPVQ
jgi:ceramide glucosyltransferase